MVNRAVVCAVLAVASLALADEPAPVPADLLSLARAAVEGVRYDEAEGLLDQALRAGDNSPAAVTEIYQLSATTATVLGKKEAATRFYRHWLALDPRAALPSDAAA